MAGAGSGGQCPPGGRLREGAARLSAAGPGRPALSSICTCCPAPGLWEGAGRSPRWALSYAWHSQAAARPPSPARADTHLRQVDSEGLFEAQRCALKWR